MALARHSMSLYTNTIMVFPHLVSWYDIYFYAVDTVCLALVILCHAAAFAKIMEQTTAMVAEEDQRKVIQFDILGSSSNDIDKRCISVKQWKHIFGRVHLRSPQQRCFLHLQQANFLPKTGQRNKGTHLRQRK